MIVSQFLYLPKLSRSEIETYDFPSKKCPSTVDELHPFESDLLIMIKNIEFRKITDVFQSKLQEDVKIVKQSKNHFISADKSTNIYTMKKDDYNRYLRENIPKTYKETDRGKVRSINYEATKIVEKLSIDNRVEKKQESQAFLTIKDQKEGFPQHVSCRLLNLSKTNIGKISKELLDKINSAILSGTKINRWKSTPFVITWFEKITHKQTSPFICFAVENFYPSISSNLFKESIEFARRLMMMIYQSLCRSQKPLFLKIQLHGFKRVVMRIWTFQWVALKALKYASYLGLIYRIN